MQLLAGGTFLLVMGVIAGEAGQFDPATVHSRSWLSLAYLVLVDSVSGFALYNWLLRTAPVNLVSTYAYAVPVVAYLVGVLVLGEPFHMLVLFGAVVIVATVAVEVRATH